MTVVLSEQPKPVPTKAHPFFPLPCPPIEHEGTNPCSVNNGDCSQLCLPTSETTRSCMCTAGYSLRSGQQACEGQFPAFPLCSALTPSTLLLHHAFEKDGVDRVLPGGFWVKCLSSVPFWGLWTQAGAREWGRQSEKPPQSASDCSGPTVGFGEIDTG